MICSTDKHIITEDLRDIIGVEFEALNNFGEIMRLLSNDTDDLPSNIGAVVGSVIDFFSRHIEENLCSALQFEAETIGYTKFERSIITHKWVRAYREAAIGDQGAQGNK